MVKKILFSLCVMCTICSGANAAKFSSGGSGACYVNDTNMFYPDEFWYCGGQSEGCAGVKHNHGANGDKAHWLSHGENFSFSGTKYWCCNQDGMQTFKSGTSWTVKTENVTEQLSGGGKCTWQKVTNVCGKVEGTKCTEATDCDAGLVIRVVGGKNVCAKPCEDGLAFKQDSTECIDCPTTASQGIVNGECRQCNKASQFFDQACKKCVAYSTMIQVSADAQQKCWMCSDSKALYACLKEVTAKGEIKNDKLLAKIKTKEGEEEVGLCSMSGIANANGKDKEPDEIPIRTACPSFLQKLKAMNAAKKAVNEAVIKAVQ